MTEIVFNETKGPYGWMSNMSAHKIRYEGEWFKTAEHLFQYMRFENMEPVTFTDKDGNEVVLDKKRIQSEIVGKSSPLLAKAVAKKYHEMSVDDLTEEESRNVTHQAEAEARHAKKVAQKYRKFHTTTLEYDIEIMKKVIRLKLAYNSELIQQLLATQKTKIYEDASTRDTKNARIWGAVREGSGWAGKNHLGEIWTDIRNELIEYFGVKFDEKKNTNKTQITD